MGPLRLEGTQFSGTQTANPQAPRPQGSCCLAEQMEPWNILTITGTPRKTTTTPNALSWFSYMSWGIPIFGPRIYPLQKLIWNLDHHTLSKEQNPTRTDVFSHGRPEQNLQHVWEKGMKKTWFTTSVASPHFPTACVARGMLGMLGVDLFPSCGELVTKGSRNVTRFCGGLSDDSEDVMAKHPWRGCPVTTLVSDDPDLGSGQIVMFGYFCHCHQLSTPEFGSYFHHLVLFFALISQLLPSSSLFMMPFVIVWLELWAGELGQESAWLFSHPSHTYCLNKGYPGIQRSIRSLLTTVLGTHRGNSAF